MNTQQQFSDPWYRFAKIINEIDVLVHNYPRVNLLDLGCHQGQFIKLMLDKYANNTSICATGVDDWDEKLKTDNSWTYFQRNLDIDFNLNAHEFNIISALEVLEHMIDTDKFLTQCYNYLVPGGHLVISTPNINSLRNRVQVPFGIYPNGLEYKNLIHHVRLYNLPSLRLHLVEHGFKPIKYLGVNFLPVKYLNKLHKLDKFLANRLPAYCGNMIVIAQKPDKA